MANFVFISDTHSNHKYMKYDVNDFININTQNVLIHSGDVSSMGTKYELEQFINWFKNLKYFDYKIFISGNHDFSFEEKNHNPEKFKWLYELLDKETLSNFNTHYLEDQELIINLYDIDKPLKIYGSPWQPKYHNWAFNIERNSDMLKEKWDMIPNDVDILVTHTPPFGYLDVNNYGQNVGCERLKDKINTITPLVHSFGHIHEDYGVTLIKETFFVNASTSNINYKVVNKPICLNIEQINDKIIVNYE